MTSGVIRAVSIPANSSSSPSRRWYPIVSTMDCRFHNAPGRRLEDVLTNSKIPIEDVETCYLNLECELRRLRAVLVEKYNDLENNPDR